MPVNFSVVDGFFHQGRCWCRWSALSFLLLLCGGWGVSCCRVVGLVVGLVLRPVSLRLLDRLVRC